jgi:hypothetical protein
MVTQCQAVFRKGNVSALNTWLSLSLGGQIKTTYEDDSQGMQPLRALDFNGGKN